jgi:hypothetical protein
MPAVFTVGDDRGDERSICPVARRGTGRDIVLGPAAGGQEGHCGGDGRHMPVVATAP